MRALLPPLVYGITAVALTWPLALHAWNHIYAYVVREDLLFMMWILRWDLHALATAPSGLFDANFLHPLPQSLARSEHLLGGLPLFAPPWLLTDNPVLALNFYTLASFVLCGVCMHLLVLRWTGSRAGAWVAGLAFAFAPWRLPDGIGRAHLLQVQWLPLMLLGLDATARTGRLAPALGAAVALALAGLNSYYIAYQAYALAAAFVIADLIGHGIRGRRRALATQAVALAAPLLVLVPLALPYLGRSALGELEYAPPDPRDAAALLGVLGHPFVLLVQLYVGRGTLALGLLGVPGLVTRWRNDRTDATRRLALIVIALTGLVLGSGNAPVLGTWLTPFRWLATVIPGFVNIRAPLRFAVLATLGLAGLAGYAVAGASGALRARRGGSVLVPAVTLAAMVLVLLPALGVPRVRTWHVPVGEEVPAVYGWLARHGDGGALIEVPMGRGVPDALAMYFSTYHWLPLVNAYTSYIPDSYRYLSALAAQLPEPQALERLLDCTGVRWILVRPDDERAGDWEHVPRVRLRDASARGHLYEVTPPAVAGRCRARLLEPTLPQPGEDVPIAGRLSVEGLEDTIPAERVQRVVVVAHNDGTATWPTGSPRAAERVSVHVSWERAGVRRARHARPAELVLPADIPPGGTVRFAAWITPPAGPGRYDLRLQVSRGGQAAGPAWVRFVTVRRP